MAIPAHSRLRFIWVFAALGLASCGGGSSSSTGPSGVTVIVRDGGAGAPSGATITLTSAGANPRTVTVAVGQAVTFVNNDSRAHEMASDPHPQHGSCPSMEAGLGTIAAGQTKITHGFANAGTCGFHDHIDASNAALQGQIIVQ
jgi:plastocyanin